MSGEKAKCAENTQLYKTFVTNIHRRQVLGQNTKDLFYYKYLQAMHPSKDEFPPTPVGVCLTVTIFC